MNPVHIRLYANIPHDIVVENLGGLKSIGRAGKAVKKQIGKTLISIGDTPDRRGHNKLVVVRNPQLFDKSRTNEEPRRNRRTKERLEDSGTCLHSSALRTYVRLFLFSSLCSMLIDVPGNEEADVDKKVHKIDTAVFFEHDIEAEASVIDSVGNRLTLDIDNVRGGGGQRRISVSCPFWIVNTTEHALRYKQENSKEFVSGTVLSPEKDGSLPLSGGRAQANYDVPEPPVTGVTSPGSRQNEGTIFSGTPGALATSPGRCDLPLDEVTQLVDKDLPIEKLAKLAFMFNFHEGLVASGHRKIQVQLGDGTGVTRYVSDWSRGFALDSVGVTQPITYVVIICTRPSVFSHHCSLIIQNASLQNAL